MESTQFCTVVNEIKYNQSKGRSTATKFNYLLSLEILDFMI